MISEFDQPHRYRHSFHALWVSSWALILRVSLLGRRTGPRGRTFNSALSLNPPDEWVKCRAAQTVGPGVVVDIMTRRAGCDGVFRGKQQGVEQGAELVRRPA